MSNDTTLSTLVKISNFLLTVATIIPLVLFSIAYLMRHSIWCVGYDLENCLGCKPKMDWTFEWKNQNVIEENHIQEFAENGFTVLQQAVEKTKVEKLSTEINNLPNTFMSDILAPMIMAHWLRYEHRLETRSEMIRDWAVHGPLGKWASQLMQSDQVRLYNVEAFYHRGEGAPRPCKPDWHRDTLSAPFSVMTRSVIFTVYLEDTSADKDGLVYMAGSHKDLSGPPMEEEDDNHNKNNIVETNIRVGDILAHDGNVYRSPSGRGCWQNRYLQFRYVSGIDDDSSVGHPTRFEFGNNRWPHGPSAWSLAHSPELFPHGLKNGDILAGPGYPQVYPKAIEEEHVPFEGKIWTIQNVFALAKEPQKVLKQNNSTGPPLGFVSYDGPVLNPIDWVSIELDGGVYLPVHKRGFFYQEYLANNNNINCLDSVGNTCSSREVKEDL